MTTSRVLKILLAEDNKQFADLLANAFSRHLHHEVLVAYDGEEAVEKANAFKPDVIFLDMGLPKQDGYAVAERLRADPLFAKTVLIALSGYGMPDDKARAEEVGFDRYLVKPVGLKELETVLLEVSEHAGKNTPA